MTSALNQFPRWTNFIRRALTVKEVKYFQENTETALYLYFPKDDLAFKSSNKKGWVHVSLPPETRVLLSTKDQFSLDDKKFELIGSAELSPNDKRVHLLAEMTTQLANDGAAMNRLRRNILSAENQISKLCRHIEIDSQRPDTE